MPEMLLPFLGVVAVLTVTPGPDMLLVLRNGLRLGPHAAWLTGLGCCLGISCHAAAAVLGLSAVLAASAGAYTAVKTAGAVYLAYLGVRMLLGSLRRSRPAPVAVGDVPGDVPGDDAAAAARGAAFRQGLLTNLLNPKIALLFLTLLPQFVGPGEPRLRTTAVLALIFLGLAVVWWRLFSLALNPVSRLLRGERARRALDGIAGVLLIAIGVRVALDHR
ncbi:LysE family translocator [Thermomonospora umbrina]|uniref:Threonine/homoserine/homoserine lactone efflux protein n=1 Tax=Thermomonospora umbrina TaxID=111806 RepID=A0A3D9T4G1_9ACTN|nr:LysE family translocator [Thermomonospora umbrina]REF00136.1 threonine/homoserine/homoserine lactone efflux protein [Thermomonospora umbrina]